MASRRGPDNSVRLAINGVCKGQNFANIFHAQLTTGSAIVQADLDTWTLGVFNAYKARFQARLTTECAVNFAKAVCYTPGNTELVSTQGVAYAGTAAASAMPGGASKVISWTSNVYWRGGKPRTYIPGLSTADWLANTDQLAVAERAAMLAAGTAYRTDVNALVSGTIATTTFGFVSFFSGNVLRVPALFFPISACVIHPRAGSQRRREGRWIN